MPKTIIWIEDDTDIIDAVVWPLEKAGFNFVRLYTAIAALEAVDQIREADLLLLDMILPYGQTEREFSDYPGVDVLRELRKIHDVTVPAIVFTVVTNEDIISRLEGLGVVDIIYKPVRPSELKKRVEQALEIES